MSSKIILLDLDGPLANLEAGFLAAWRAKFPNEFFIPIDQRKTFFAYQDYPQELRPNIEELWELPGLFRNLSPVPGGIEAAKEMVALGHKVFICTSAIYKHPTGLEEKRAWVREHLGDDLARTIVFTKDKTLVHGDYLVDDKPHITGCMQLSWQHVIFDQPFNRDVHDKPRIAADWSNWKEIIL